MINQIEEIPAWFPLIDDALGVALNALDDARGYASHEHDGGEGLAVSLANEAWARDTMELCE